MIRRLDGKRSRLLTLVVTLCLLSLLLDAWQRAAQRAGAPTWLDGTVCAAASPLETLLAEGVRGLEAAAARLARTQRLEDQNATLRTRLSELQARLVALEEEQGRSARERTLRAAAAPLDRNAPLAAVIGWGENGWTSYLILDRGERSGVRVKDVALAKEGVVGQVYAVSSTTARVLPITDPASGVAVLVRPSRETGVLKGIGDGRCELRDLGPEARLVAGDLVLTSGSGGVFPKGLVLGTVVSARQNRDAPGRVAMVQPAVELWRVEEVALVRAPEAR